jgi:hypothetical protein
VSKERPNPAIIVKFVTHEGKAAWTNAALINRQRLTTAAISNSWPSHGFYINHYLMAYNEAILGKTHRAVREKKLVSVWCRDCKLFAKKSSDPGIRPTILRTMEDLDKCIG